MTLFIVADYLENYDKNFDIFYDFKRAPNIAASTFEFDSHSYLPLQLDIDPCSYFASVLQSP